jgi:uncharacterized protein YdhG (YjbR/CyaY superfamily)
LADISNQVDQYIAKQDAGRKAALETIRSTIFELIPDVTETFKYNMPTYELDEVVVSVAAQKHYFSLYLDTTLVAKYRQELGHLNCGKSCVRFRRLEELPLDTIKKIILETAAKQTNH